MTLPSAFPAPTPPMAEKRPVADTRHGVTRVDDYAWLRAENWREVFKDPKLLDPAIRAYLEAENAYQSGLMADTAELRQILFAEMKGRIKEDDSSVPLRDGAYAYGSSYAKGGEQPRFFRVPAAGGQGNEEQEMLLDGDQEAEGKTYFRIGGVDHSADHKRLLWSFDDKGSEFFSLRVRDLASGANLPDEVADTGGGGVWTPDGSGFLYTRLDPNHRPSKIMFHVLGSDPAEDRLVYEETDPGFFMGVAGSRLKDWAFIGINDHGTSEYRLIDLRAPLAEPRLVFPRETGLQYDMEEGGHEFFILTNADGAKDFQVMAAPVSDPRRENWRVLVPHEPGRLILGIQSFHDFLVRLERAEGLPRIVIRDRRTREEHTIRFPEEAYALGLSGAYEYATDSLRFTYSSMTTPAQVFDYHMRTRERKLLKTQEVPSGHDASAYVARRLMAPAHDGELVPVSLLHRRDLKLDGSAPCLLYGYGAYGITVPAGFNTNALSLVDRGFVYAIAHVRGGKDKGFSWYENGRREHKPNTFRDFLAVARHLVAQGYTAHDRIVAQGGSAGGLLIGAVANMEPHLFGALVAEVPFVDVLNTMLDDTLPLTPPEWPEWGNPIASEADYRVIASYSPYDNVEALPYPPILAIAGLTDPRVTYWEPAKWVAKLRAFSHGRNPILFKIHMDSGHGGASGRFSRLEEIAFTYSFALKCVGLAETSPATVAG